MTRDLLNATTATSDNALTETERDALLADKLEARLGTNRADGWPHITPIWYLWQEATFLLSLGNGRRHLDNIRGDSHVTLCVDVDHRPEGPGQAALAAVCFGQAELIEDEQDVRKITERIELRYLGAVPPEFEQALWFEGRTAVVITPVRWLTWALRSG
jgi:PPOX class probable F420-dependent enzyme